MTMQEVEDLSFAVCRYDDDSLAQVTSSVVHHGEEQGIELQCANAKLSAPWDVKAEVSQENGFWKPGGNKELVDQINSYYEQFQILPMKDILEKLTIFSLHWKQEKDQ